MWTTVGFALLVQETTQGAVQAADAVSGGFAGPGAGLLSSAVLVAALGTLGSYLVARRQFRAEIDRAVAYRTDSFGNRRRAVYEEFLTHLNKHPNTPGGGTAENVETWDDGYRREYVKLVTVCGRNVLELIADADPGNPDKPNADTYKRLARAMHKDLFPRDYRNLRRWLRERLGK